MSQIQKSHRNDLIGLAVLTLILVGLTLILENSYYQTLLVISEIYAIAAIGLSLLFGYAGQISIGQSAFFGLGAYMTANLVQRFNIEPVLALGGSALFSAAVGYLIARPLLRLSSHYLAMATLAFGVVMSIAFGQLKAITGGFDPGIIAMPAFRILDYPLGDIHSMMWVCGAALVIVMALCLNLIHSRIGRALRALRGSEYAAAGLGVDTRAYKVAVFALAAGLAGVAGSLYAFFLRSFTASAFDVTLSIELLVMIVIGSVSSLWGALIGAVVITLLPNLLEHFHQYKMLIYGLLMVSVMIFMPNGLFQGLFDSVTSLRARRSQS
jgi:branched-chain amino acid transport system permease protein